MVGMNAPEDVYTHGHAESVLRSHRWRTAENSAGYLLPRLREDARILDVGLRSGHDHRRPRPHAWRRVACVGLDRSEDVIAEARATARRAGVANVEFGVGDVYALDHEADTFDVVHAHQVLQHLSDPVAALREMARVCRPDGLVAVRDSDYSAFTWWPGRTRARRVARPLPRGRARQRRRARRRSSAEELGAGRRARACVASTAGVWCFATPEDVAWWGGMWADRIVGSSMAEQAVERGLASTEDLQRLSQGWRRWAGSGGRLVRHPARRAALLPDARHDPL